MVVGVGIGAAVFVVVVAAVGWWLAGVADEVDVPELADFTGFVDGTDDRSEPEVAAAWCGPDLVGSEDGPVTSIYAIEEGRLAGLCWGDPDEVVTGAFAVLAAVTPPGQLDDLAYMAGFDGGAATLAFVTPVDDDYSGFVMAIDIVSAIEDPAELRLTVVHEFAHVFTQRRDQLDVWADPFSCSTLWNGAGCFVPGSYLDSWINEFWTDEELRSLPIDGSIDEDGGVERCAVDPGFLGSYAASHPEEDFAEAYSAFVFDLDVPPGVQPRLAFFEDFPELAEARALATAADVGPVRNNFDLCG